MECYYLDSEIGILEIKGDSKGLSSVIFTNNPPHKISDKVPKHLEKTVLQLREYLVGNRKEFTVKLNPEGTDFQKKVWMHLQTINYGKTKSYQQMANELGDPKVIRAAASANGKNPISIVIPCHRVIGSDGSLTGYAGGLHRKKWLLAHESPVKQGLLF